MESCDITGCPKVRPNSTNFRIVGENLQVQDSRFPIPKFFLRPFSPFHFVRSARYRNRENPLYQSSAIPLSFARHPLYSRRTRKQRVPACLSSFLPRRPHALAGYSIYLLSRPPTRGVRPVWTFLPCVIYYPARTPLARSSSSFLVHPRSLTTTHDDGAPRVTVSRACTRADAARTCTQRHTHTYTTAAQYSSRPPGIIVSRELFLRNTQLFFFFNARRLTLIWKIFYKIRIHLFPLVQS